MRRIAARQFEENLAAELRGARAYEASREQRRGTKRLGGPPKPYTAPEIPPGEVNVTDPERAFISRAAVFAAIPLP